MTRSIEKKLVSPKLEAIRDIFIFSCFSGLAYIDIANLPQGLRYHLHERQALDRDLKTQDGHL